MTHPHSNILIAGGGLAGSLVALALAERRPDLRILLIERGKSFGGQHVWSFFDTDVDPAGRKLVEPLVSCSWADHEVAFPARRRTIPVGYNSVRSSRLDSVLKQRLGPHRYRLNFEVVTVSADHIVGRSGERVDADVVLDARGPDPMPSLALGWQKFLGRTYRFERPHGLVRPTIMDATVEQSDGYRFSYLLPFDNHEALIEDTYYSDDPQINRAALATGLDAMAAAFGESSLVDQETGVLPVVISGDVADLWRGAAAPLLGIRGGFFHPTTGYSLPDAARNALLLAEQSDFTPGAIHALLRTRAEQLWKDRSFFRLLNGMLFRGAEPLERYRVLQHFYRLPEATISRFYAGQLNLSDKARILSGKPPVPVGRALRAVLGSAA